MQRTFRRERIIVSYRL